MFERTTNPIGRCLYCGSADGEAYHYHYETGSPPVRLWCTDERACKARQDAEESQADVRVLAQRRAAESRAIAWRG